MHTATTRRTTALHTDWSSSWITQRGPGRGGQATSSRTAPPALGLRVTRLDRGGQATRARHRVAPLDSTGKPCCAGWHSRGAASRPATGQTRRRLEPTETVGGRARKGRYPGRAGCPHRQLRSRAGRPHERCKARSSRPIDGGAFHAGSHTEPERPTVGPTTLGAAGPYPTVRVLPGGSPSSRSGCPRAGSPGQSRDRRHPRGSGPAQARRPHPPRQDAAETHLGRAAPS